MTTPEYLAIRDTLDAETQKLLDRSTRFHEQVTNDLRYQGQGDSDSSPSVATTSQSSLRSCASPESESSMVATSSPSSAPPSANVPLRRSPRQHPLPTGEPLKKRVRVGSMVDLGTLVCDFSSTLALSLIHPRHPRYQRIILRPSKARFS